MKRKIFYTFMTTLFVIAGAVACGSTNKKEKAMKKDNIKQEQTTERQEEKEVEEIKEETQVETPAQNVEQETTVQEQPNSVESVPPATEQPSIEQPVQNDKTEHSVMPKTEPPVIESGSIGSVHNEPPVKYVEE